MRYIHPETQAVLTLAKFQESTANPSATLDDMLARGYVELTEVEKPAFNPLTQAVAECDPSLVDGVWRSAWRVVDLDPATYSAVIDRIANEFDRALTDHFDAVAQADDWDNRITCMLRSGFVGPYQAKGIAFAQWVDECNTLAYQMQAEVVAGTRPLPASTAAFLAELPIMVWPSDS